MKTSMTLKSITLITLLGATLAMPAFGQGGMGMGGGPGMQNGGRGMNFNQSNTRGWTLMTQEEQSAFQTKMREVKTYDECKMVQTEHRSAMEIRAKEKGVTLQAPRQNACDNMKARGIIK